MQVTAHFLVQAAMHGLRFPIWCEGVATRQGDTGHEVRGHQLWGTMSGSPNVMGRAEPCTHAGGALSITTSHV